MNAIVNHIGELADAGERMIERLRSHEHVGSTGGAGGVVYGFRLDDYVPADHLLRLWRATDPQPDLRSRTKAGSAGGFP